MSKTCPLAVSRKALLGALAGCSVRLLQSDSGSCLKTGIELASNTGYAHRMSMSIQQIEAEAMSLPSEARALLIDRLVESLDPTEDESIHPLWAVEALKRRDDVRNGVVQTIPGDEALARVKRAVAR